jgi:hypothetical protein
MEETPEKRSGAEEYVAAEIAMAQPIGAAEEKAIRDTLAKAEGVRIDSLGIDECRVTIHYDPTRITKDALMKLIRQAGVKLSDTKTERAPII